MAITYTLDGTVTSTSAGTGTALTLSQSYAVGDIIVVALGRATNTGYTMGLASVGLSSGAATWTLNPASASRALTMENACAVGVVTSPVSAGATLTATSNSDNAKRGMVVVKVAGADTVEMSTGNLAAGNNGSTSYGLQNASASISQSLPATTTDDSLVLAILAPAGQNAWTPSGSWQHVGTARTSSGSSDRGVVVLAVQQTAAGVETFTGSFAASSGWSLTSISLTPTAGPAGTFLIVDTDGVFGLSDTGPATHYVDIDTDGVYTFTATSPGGYGIGLDTDGVYGFAAIASALTWYVRSAGAWLARTVRRRSGGVWADVPAP